MRRWRQRCHGSLIESRYVQSRTNFGPFSGILLVLSLLILIIWGHNNSFRGFCVLSGYSIYIHGLSEVETSGDSVQNESEKEEIGENEKLKRNKTAIIIRNRIKDKLEGRDPDGNTVTSVKQQVLTLNIGGHKIRI